MEQQQQKCGRNAMMNRTIGGGGCCVSCKLRARMDRARQALLIQQLLRPAWPLLIFSESSSFTDQAVKCNSKGCDILIARKDNLLAALERGRLDELYAIKLLAFIATNISYLFDKVKFLKSRFSKVPTKVFFSHGRKVTSRRDALCRLINE